MWIHTFMLIFTLVRQLGIESSNPWCPIHCIRSRRFFFPRFFVPIMVFFLGFRIGQCIIALYFFKVKCLLSLNSFPIFKIFFG